jgi:hypothetical protein
MGEEHTKPWQAEEPDEASVNFLKEMVLSQTSAMGLLGSLTAGAILSIPLGLGIGVLPLLAYGAAQSIATMFIPSSPVFRERVMRRKRSEKRTATRAHLLEELEARSTEAAPQWQTYGRMRDRLRSLEKLAESRGTGLGYRDVERLDDATVDYLGLWLGWIVMGDRYNSTDEVDLERKLEHIREELELDDLGGVERNRLEKARQDLQGILERRRSLWARATGLEAAMLAMADTFEEVFQRVVANPASGDVSAELSQAVERMRVEEALDLAVDDELEDLFRRRKAATHSRQTS